MPQGDSHSDTGSEITGASEDGERLSFVESDPNSDTSAYGDDLDDAASPREPQRPQTVPRFRAGELGECARKEDDGD